MAGEPTQPCGPSQTVIAVETASNALRHPAVALPMFHVKHYAKTELISLPELTWLFADTKITEYYI